MRHIKEAGRLGNQDALLQLAERFDDPSFFEQQRRNVDVTQQQLPLLQNAWAVLLIPDIGCPQLPRAETRMPCSSS
ncbi:MAG: hypothetical protein ABIR84_07225 [Candidatus Nitrotoga sp.]